jgi:Tfp pilus assembly protein PilO
MAPTLQSQIRRYGTLQGGLGVVALLLTAAFYLIGIRPAQTQRALIESTITAQEKELRLGQARAQSLPVVEHQVEELRSRLQRFDKKLPKKPDMDQFMRDITRVSDAASLKKVTVQPGTPKRSDLFSEMPITLNFTGDFPSVVTFLKQTEEMQRLTRVRSLAIKTKDPQKGSVEVDVSMSIYFADE